MRKRTRHYLNHLIEAIECERKEEMNRHIQEIKRITGHGREAKGRALMGMKKQKTGYTLGGDLLYRFQKKDRSYLPELEIRVGDEVLISQFDPLHKRNPRGTVYAINNTSMTVACREKIRFSNKKSIRLDLYINDITFKRMKEAVQTVIHKPHGMLAQILDGQVEPVIYPATMKLNGLNKSQEEAIINAVGSRGFYSIQGPPGTGKTYTAAKLIQSAVKNRQKVLVTADSNAAVDHLLRFLLQLDLKAMRIGNPIRINADLLKHTFDYKVTNHPMMQQIEGNHREIEFLRHEQREYKKPEMRFLRGLSYKEAYKLAIKNRTTRGIPSKAIQEMKPWLEIQHGIDQVYEKIKQTREKVQNDLFEQHDIIAVTNSTAACDLLQDQHFDVLVMDEAAQATLPSSLIPSLKADHLIYIGDHQQLPPTIISREAKGLGLDRSLMAYLAALYPEMLSVLKRQYRMNQQLNDLVSSMFYQGQLVPDTTVKEQCVKALGEPIEWVESNGEEAILGDSSSYYNAQEIELVVELIKKLRIHGVKDVDMAVITPYKAQAVTLEESLGDTAIEIDTVDAFQGREKDVVILSLVRSNSKGNLGFLTDYRRLNVSISRAKKKLYLVGNSATLSHDDVYVQLMRQVQ